MNNVHNEPHIVGGESEVATMNLPADAQTFSPDQMPSFEEDDEFLDLGADFDFDEFQVVRREFFAHLREPAISFNNCKVYVNAACISKFPNTDYVQVLVNQEKKILALRPCSEGDRDSFLWCTESKGKRKARQITAKLFFAKIFTMMDWNPDYRYKLLGRIIHSKGMYLIAFDLTSTEVYQKTFVEGEKPKSSRNPVFPTDWQNQFGLPFNEHRQSMQINIFDGYAIYAIKDTRHQESKSGIALPTVVNASSGEGGNAIE